MKCFRFVSTAALALLAIAPTADAQRGASDPITPYPTRAPVLVGPVIGSTRNFHTGGFRTVTGDLTCPIFEDGSGWGFLGGLTAELLLFDGSALIPRVTYESRPGSFTSHLPDALVQLPGMEGTTLQTVTATSEIAYGILNTELMYKHEIGELGSARIALAGGPAIAWVMTGSNRQVQDLVTPTNARFQPVEGYELENDGRRLVFYDGEIVARRDMRFSLKAGMQAEVGLFGNRWYMTPGLYYDYGISDVTGAENWQLNTVMFMVDFRRGF